MQFFQPFNALSYRAQAEQTAVNVIKVHPLQPLNIIVGTQRAVLFDAAYEEHVHCGNLHARVTVSVRNAEQIFCGRNLQARLLEDLACDALFGILTTVAEASRQVQCSFGRLF